MRWLSAVCILFKFRYFIGVRLNNSETDWYYAVGEKTSEMAPCRDKVDWIVDKALYALFGIPG